MTLTAGPTVVIDDRPLRLSDVVAISRGARVELGPAALDKIAASRAVVDRLAEGEALIYGLNTGLGHMRNERMPAQAIEASQVMTVRAHAGGLGPPLATEVVRAAIAVRVAGMAMGGSGASPAIAEAYVAMLNARIHPIVPEIGSIGASDLMHMAAIALVAMGEGEAEVDGVRMPGDRALAQAGIDPIRLRAKDGLTVISANGVAVGHAALVVERAARLIDRADAVLALSMEATGANPSIVEPAVAAAKPVPGQAVSAARIRSLIAGSGLCGMDTARSVQDPLSFRVAPQVHGAFREVVAFAVAAVDGELAAMDDNPLVSLAEDRMISNGNFHPMLLALAVDAVRPALAHVGQLSDRRTGQLWDTLASDANAFTPEALGAMLRFGSPLLRYTGAARVAELRGMAGPATLDVPPLDLGVEDHATNAPLAARLTEAAIDIAEDVIAVELLTAAASVGWRDDVRARLAPGTAAIHQRLGTAIGEAGPGASNQAVHQAAKRVIRGLG